MAELWNRSLKELEVEAAEALLLLNPNEENQMVSFCYQCHSHSFQFSQDIAPDWGFRRLRSAISVIPPPSPPSPSSEPKSTETLFAELFGLSPKTPLHFCNRSLHYNTTHSLKLQLFSSPGSAVASSSTQSLNYHQAGKQLGEGLKLKEQMKSDEGMQFQKGESSGKTIWCGEYDNLVIPTEASIPTFQGMTMAINFGGPPIIYERKMGALQGAEVESAVGSVEEACSCLNRIRMKRKWERMTATRPGELSRHLHQTRKWRRVIARERKRQKLLWEERYC